MCNMQETGSQVAVMWSRRSLMFPPIPAHGTMHEAPERDRFT